VLGPHFEKLARQFVFAVASEATVGGRASTVGSAVVNDAKGRAQHQLDVVALKRQPNGSQSVLAIGEAKHTATQRTISGINRLEHIRELVGAKEPTAASARLLLFSANGFEQNLIEHAKRRADIDLIDLKRIYSGD
jgi:uncharacterized protein